MDSKPIAVIGIGNAFRSDDGIGLFVARQVNGLGLDGVKVVEGIGDGYALIDAWAGSETAFVVDCAYSGTTPGTTYRFDALREPIPAYLFSGVSTHSISINDAVTLAKVLNRLPGGLIVYGIEGKKFTPGTNLTEQVKQTAMEVVTRIADEIKALSDARSERE